MKDKLKIERHLHLKRVVLSLDGRIDAYWSAILDEAISNEIRSGHYRISLDLLLVDYLSSAGIRVLVKCYKEMKAINGDFSLINGFQVLGFSAETIKIAYNFLLLCNWWQWNGKLRKKTKA